MENNWINLKLVYRTIIPAYANLNPNQLIKFGTEACNLTILA
jgi:hypothetical protein